MDNTCTVYNVAHNKQSIYYIVCVFCATYKLCGHLYFTFKIKSVLQDLPNSPCLNLTIMLNIATRQIS